MNSLEKEFVPYQESLELKELGFNEPCLVSWNFYTNEFNYNASPSTFTNEDVIQLPTFSQAFRWFRDKYGLSYSIEEKEIIEGQTDLLYIDENEEPEYMEWLARVEPYFIETFKTYEEAELACLRKLIEITKQ